MKTGLLLYLVLSLSLTSASAQQVLRQAGQPKGSRVALSTIQSPRALSRFLNANQGGKPLLDPGVCQDSSGNKLIGLQNQLIQFISSTHTKDDGVLMAGTITDTTIANWGQVYNAFLLKTDNRGNVLWCKSFGDGAHNIYSNTEFNLVAELQSGEIIVAGQCFNTTSKQIGSELLARYDASGNLKWNKTYSSLIAQNAQFSPVDFRSIVDGINGDLIICGTVMSNAGANLTFTTIRMTGDGNVLWDVNYHHPGGGLGSEGLAAKFDGNKILSVGLDHGSSIKKIPAAVELLYLNYFDGSLVSRRLYASSYSDPTAYLSKQFTYFYNHCAFQDNGHMIVYGALYSDISHNTLLTDHFGVMEFDAGLNLVDAYSVSSYIQDNAPAAVMHFDSKGRGIFLIESSYIGDISQTFTGVLKNRQLQSQRYKRYSNTQVSNSGGFGENVRTVSFNDGSYVLSQNLSQAKPDGKGGSYIDFKKMHLSDTSSDCVGIDTTFSQTQPLRVIEKAYAPDYTNEVFTKQLTRTTFNLVPIAAPATTLTNGCTQTNYCDTLKIHGDTVFCSGEGPQIFSAFKNAACGTIVQWLLDSNFVASDSVLNDTSISVRFKKVDGVTKIRSSLPGGTCTSGLADSLLIRIVSSPKAPDFGNDTTLCGGNSILLKTEQGFSSYLWQDGSTGTDFLVSKPGRYFISVQDACMNVLKDTIDITDAQNSFSAGNDTVKCNGDTIRLKASRGFDHYTWSPAYNLDSINAQYTPAFPELSSTYSVTATRGTNCAVTATVQVNVLHSASIDLGGDTSLCSGSFLPLDAGPGFTDYRWSNGSRFENILASAPGVYAVAATAANGCISKASMQVVTVYPVPVFSLASGLDTTICDGQALNYRFSSASAAYLWNDGSTASQRSITDPGVYSLTVTDKKCSATKTVDLFVKPTPNVDLGSDAFLCPGDTKALDAVSDPGVSWKWQDGSTGSQYRVSRSGLYSVSVTLDGCTRSDSVRVTYLDKPKIMFPKDTMICAGQTMLLDPRLSTQADYLWQDGSVNQTFNTTSTGLYSLTTSNICGTDEASVQVIPGVCQIILPNAFTPNRDGKNDVFKIRYFFPVQSFRMRVFNRSGQLVFESSDMTKGWNGTLGSFDQPQGGYTWFVEMVTLTGEHSTSNGVLLLLR